jgi:Na+/Pi-cotransporter
LTYLKKFSCQSFGGQPHAGAAAKIADTPVKGLFAGTLITGVLQSSTAMTVMVVGLRPAISIIMGANIGTTLGNGLIALPLGPLGLILAGLFALVYVFAKVEKTKNAALAFMGFFGGDPGKAVIDANGKETFPLVPAAVGIYSAGFNIFNTAVLFPFIGVFERVLSRIGQRITAKGAGSTFAHLLMSAWARDYRVFRHGGVAVVAAGGGLDDEISAALDYEAIGSQAGIQRVKARAVDFAVSEMSLPAADYTFTAFLAQSSADWRNQVGSDLLVNWPVGEGYKGNSGVARALQRTPNAIGYLDLG